MNNSIGTKLDLKLDRADRGMKCYSYSTPVDMLYIYLHLAPSIDHSSLSSFACGEGTIYFVFVDSLSFSR